MGTHGFWVPRQNGYPADGALMPCNTLLRHDRRHDRRHPRQTRPADEYLAGLNPSVRPELVPPVINCAIGDSAPHDTMAEAVALAASVFAVIQLSERIASICKFYIGDVHDYPKDLRLIYVEVGSLKVLFEGLSFLDQEDEEENTTLRALQAEDGPVARCKEAVEELGKLFPSVPLGHPSSRRWKEKLRAALAGLEWPLKASAAGSFWRISAW